MSEIQDYYLITYTEDGKNSSNKNPKQNILCNLNNIEEEFDFVKKY